MAKHLDIDDGVTAEQRAAAAEAAAKAVKDDGRPAGDGDLVDTTGSVQVPGCAQVPVPGADGADPRGDGVRMADGRAGGADSAGPGGFPRRGPGCGEYALDSILMAF